MLAGRPSATAAAGAGGRAGVRRRRRLGHAVAVATYLAAAVWLWWGIWSGHPTTAATCGCGDTSLFTWAMAFPQWALTHGGSLLATTRLHHPAGFNIMANTTVLGLSLPLMPVTVLAGPVASLAVAATLAPVASALAARAVALRWTTWRGAAFVAGAFYGFSPFVLEVLRLEHVDMAMLAVPPLLLLCLDELLVTQRRRAWPVGVALGCLVAFEFFVSPEVLVMCALAASAGIVLLVAVAAARHRDAVVARWRHAATGLGIGTGMATALLAYPAWYAIAGPRHLPRQLFPDQQYFGNSWQSILLPARPLDRGPNHVLELYGYFGPHPLLRGYLGVTLAAVVIAGLAWFRRDLRLWFTVVLAAGLEACSLGATAWPWRLLGHVPVIENVVPGRLAAVADLFVALALALVVDHVHTTVTGWWRGRQGAGVTGWQARWVAATSAAATAAVALVPVAAGAGAPFTVRNVDVPAWFTSVGAHLPSSAVVLTYPTPSSGLQAPMTWQAVTRLRFALVGGGGITPAPAPAPTPDQLAEAAAGRDLAALSYGFVPVPRVTAAEVGRLRRAVGLWGVTQIVVPTETATPVALQPRSVPLALATFTAVVGHGPAFTGGAWVWSISRDPTPPLDVATGLIERCATAPGTSGDPARAATCVLAGTASPIPGDAGVGGAG